MSEILLEANEHIEPLGNGVSLIVSDIHRFGTDALLLAEFTAPRKGEAVCDLCSGCGIIPIIWQRMTPPKHVTAVELQRDAASMLLRSVELNGFSERISVINADLRQLSPGKELRVFDAVSVNPPYKPVGTGLTSAPEGELIARHEVMCTVFDVCRTASAILRYGGRLCMCHRPERLCDVTEAMRKAGIEPKRLRFIAKSADSEPWLLLVEGRKGGGKGLRILPTLCIDGWKPDFFSGAEQIKSQQIGEKANG